MVLIKFIGTGGGRYVMISQERLTGGLVIEHSNSLVAIDPGPSAVYGYKLFGVPVWRIDGLIVSHGHPDHYAEADVVIEGMTHGGQVKKGLLAISEYMHARGYGVSPYHRNLVEKYYVLKEGISVSINSLRVHPFRVFHTEPSTTGFRIEVGGKTITYVADTKYFSKLRHYIDKSDLVILPVTLPRDYRLPHHLNTSDAVMLLKDVDIGLCVITHFGAKMIEIGPEREAKWIKDRTGCEVIAARDGLNIEL